MWFVDFKMFQMRTEALFLQIFSLARYVILNSFQDLMGLGVLRLVTGIPSPLFYSYSYFLFYGSCNLVGYMLKNS